jgi:deazaflavin-dependent oxidoreductase (nitroreductase family)
MTVTEVTTRGSEPSAPEPPPCREELGVEELGYPEWMARAMPTVHSSFNAVNKYVSVPAFKMGLGPLMSTPATGYLMILRTRGRKSGEMRDAPLGYTICGDAVYCIAGFGRGTHWLQNLLADGKVEVILPGRSFTGHAEEVTDAGERARVLPQLLRSMGAVVIATGLGNPWRDPDEVIVRKAAAFPLVRIRATGIAAGPEDPRGWFWVVPLAVVTWLAWRRLRSRGRRACS